MHAYKKYEIRCADALNGSGTKIVGMCYTTPDKYLRNIINIYGILIFYNIIVLRLSCQMNYRNADYIRCRLNGCTLYMLDLLNRLSTSIFLYSQTLYRLGVDIAYSNAF
jgi:hypothetical protein